MKRTTLLPSPFPARATAIPEFKCVLIYEDFAAGERADRFYKRLVAAMDDACVPARSAWNFPALAIPEIRNSTASAAAVADVVVFAFSGKAALPSKVREWVEMWARLIDETKPAVVALGESHEAESRTIREFLRLVAVGKRLAFFTDNTCLPDLLTAVGSPGKIGENSSARTAWKNAGPAAFAFR